jgi:hypothetical protein
MCRSHLKQVLHTENTHVATHGRNINLSDVLRLIIEDLRIFLDEIGAWMRLVLTSDGDAKVKTISAADPEAGAGVLAVACVRADISLNAGLRLAVAVRINKRAAAIAICNEMNKNSLDPHIILR